MTEDQDFELSDAYKVMIDRMLAEEDNGTAKYISAEEIKNRFLNQRSNLQ
ncbi:MAG: hypothetical protein V4560_10425 [Bacteroidota bacterium]